MPWSALAIWPGLLLVIGGALKLSDDEEDSVLARLRVPPRVLAAIELIVGVAVLAGVPLAAAAAAVLFAAAAGVSLWGLRHAPQSSCGCFGRRSETVSARTVVRAGLLAALALAAALGGEAWWHFDAAAVALVLAAGAVLLALTPELRPRDVRLRAREAACRHKPVPVGRTLARLRASELWREARGYLAAESPLEQWRDGCFRYLVYPATYAGEEATAVFALYLGRDRAADGVAFVSEGEQRVLGQINGGKRA